VLSGCYILSEKGHYQRYPDVSHCVGKKLLHRKSRFDADECELFGAFAIRVAPIRLSMYSFYVLHLDPSHSITNYSCISFKCEIALFKL
jgi:hypothetical protein